MFPNRFLEGKVANYPDDPHPFHVLATCTEGLGRFEDFPLRVLEKTAKALDGMGIEQPEELTDAIAKKRKSNKIKGRIKGSK